METKSIRLSNEAYEKLRKEAFKKNSKIKTINEELVNKYL